jgi:hypothetical protein
LAVTGERMKIELTRVGAGACVTAAIGVSLVGLAVAGVGAGSEQAWAGLVVLILGCLAWVHDRLDRLADRLGQREIDAYNMGKLAAGPTGSVVTRLPRPRTPETTP